VTPGRSLRARWAFGLLVLLTMTTAACSATSTQGDSSTQTTSTNREAPPPVVAGITPTSGSTAGGTSVTITGTNLNGATKVTFGTVAATNVVVISATKITATSPPQSASLQNVFVTTAGGTSQPKLGVAPFSYAAPTPAVTAITPVSGPTSGGTTITITGTGFTGTDKVAFGNVTATSFTVVSDTSITAVSPPQAPGHCTITVTSAGGKSAALSSARFSYGVPVVSALSPTSGPTAGGTIVTVTGTGFTGANKVLFGGVEAPRFTDVSDTEITAISPSQAAGHRPVYVVTAGGQSESTAASPEFDYQAPTPVVSALSPRSGPTAGGTIVTITGTGFTGANKVVFGGVEVSRFTVVSDTEITAISPSQAVGPRPVVVITPGGESAKVTASQFSYVT
jgi:hypothetical protein